MAIRTSLDYNQDFLFPPTLEEFVAPEHPARFIREFVDALSLTSLGIDWTPEEAAGAPAYPAHILLRAWLYGYYLKLRSSRAIEKACVEQLGMMWLVQMHQPDHNTLWRFFKRNKKALRKLFKQSVKVAIHADLLGWALHALDGTKIHAEVADRSGFHREKLMKALKRLDEVLEELERCVESDAADSQELPQRLEKCKLRREDILEALQSLDEAGLDHLNPHDPDTRTMPCKDLGRNGFGYNCQAMVDEQSGLIVAQDVVNDANDLGQLCPMLENTQETIGKTAELTVADSGYCNGAQIAKAETGEHAVMTNLSKRHEPGPESPYHARNFQYDPERNVCICPQGEELPFERSRYHKQKDQTLRVYRCQNKLCPVREQCTKERRGRSIEIGPHHEAMERHRAKHADESQRAQLAKRRHIVEPVFGYIKEQLGFRRFTLRGLEKARAQWALLCTVFNLKKLYSKWKEGKLALKAPPDPEKGSDVPADGPEKPKNGPTSASERCFRPGDNKILQFSVLYHQHGGRVRLRAA